MHHSAGSFNYSISHFIVARLRNAFLQYISTVLPHGVYCSRFFKLQRILYSNSECVPLNRGNKLSFEIGDMSFSMRKAGGLGCELRQNDWKSETSGIICHLDLRFKTAEALFFFSHFLLPLLSI